MTTMDFSLGRKFNRRELVRVQGDQVLAATIEVQCQGCFRWCAPADMALHRHMTCLVCATR